MNKVETVKLEDVKTESVDSEESRRRVAFLQKMAEKLRVQLLDDSSAGILQEGSLDKIDSRQDLHGGEKLVRTNLVELISAINENNEELESLRDLESKQRKCHITNMRDKQSSSAESGVCLLT